MPTETYQLKHPLRAWIVCLTASLYFFYEFVQMNMFNALDPYLLKDFNLSATELGHLSAYYFYANVLMLFPAGILIDRFSTRKLIFVCMLIAILSTLGFALAPSVRFAELCRFFTGIASAFCLLSCIRLASRWFPPQRLALVIGTIIAMGFLGGTVAQTPLTLLVDHFGWRRALMADAAFGVLLLTLIFSIVRDFPPGQSELLHTQYQHLKELGFWQSLKRAIGNKQNWLAGLYSSLLNLPIFLLGALWGGLYLVQVHHLTRTESSFITSMIFIGAIAGSPAIGWFSDRIAQRKMPMIVCAIFSLVVILAIIFLSKITVSAGMLLFFLLGFFTCGQIISFPLIAESNARALTGTSTSIASILIMSGGFTQPFFGWLMERNWDHQLLNAVPLYSLQDYRMGLAIMPIAFILGLVAAFFIKETHCRLS